MKSWECVVLLIIYDFFISENQGFWREFGFGMISIFKSDLQRAGGYDLTIEGWGMEDVRLIEALIAFLHYMWPPRDIYVLPVI